MTSRPFSTSASVSISARLIIPPVGLFGELRINRNSTAAAGILRDGLPQFRKPRGRSVMRPTLVKRALGGVNNVAGGGKIRLSDFEMNDLPALRFERPRANQDIKGTFGPEPGHATGKPQFSSFHERQKLLSGQV